MTDRALQVGDIVRIIHRTGVYAGEIIAAAPERYTFKTLAVLKHPTQGDLHSPFQTDVTLFHERKALAYQEKVNVPPGNISLYTQELPDYRTSLAQTLENQIQELQARGDEWAKRSIAALEELKKDYGLVQ
ncbi:sporulation phosphorelay system protein KapB [Brevibacillus dissolubilis]|uniref:sporulation phosphorelay system protein KapB n=1 Tax=Brevibacillus dissolubilis TaxID=1844116 RepID=UPI001115EA2D|nr:sporulation phosphorelay system protein KapB [Brevibacillus dissolubilis]